MKVLYEIVFYIFRIQQLHHLFCGRLFGIRLQVYRIDDHLRFEHGSHDLWHREDDGDNDSTNSCVDELFTPFH